MSTLNYSVETMTDERLIELGRSLATYLVNNGILEYNQPVEIEIESHAPHRLLEI